MDQLKKNIVDHYIHSKSWIIEIIKEKEVTEAILNGTVIENYPEDEPYPSCLINGTTGRGRPLHIVCALAEEEDILIIITVYKPDPEKWIENKRRKIWNA